MKLLDIHSQSLAKAATLSGFQVVNAISPHEVIAILNKHKISFVLVGAYGLAGWTKAPRATEDVDVVVAARHHNKATKTLLAAFPNLEADDQEVVTRLRDKESKNVGIDLMKPNQLCRAAFKNTWTVGEGKKRHRIPSLEMVIALSYAPMVLLPWSEADKYRFAHDFILILKMNPTIDLETLAELGDLVYPGGGKEIVEKVRQVRAGEKLQL